MNEPNTTASECASASASAKEIGSNRKPLMAFLLGLCCLGFFIADIATPNFFTDPLPAMLAIGVMTAQLTVICVWGTLVRGTFWIRLPWTFLLLVISWCGFAWGVRISDRGADTEAMLGTAVIWAFGFATSFVPLKIAAVCLRWQIIKDGGGPEETCAGSRYAIRDIMIGTFLLALSMGIGRTILPDGQLDLTRAIAANSLENAGLWVVLVIFGVISMLVKVPCIWISLGVNAEKVISRIGLWVVYCFLLSLLEIMLLLFFLPGVGSGGTAEVFLGMIISNQIMGGSILSVGLLLRGAGYRLTRPRNRQHGSELMLGSENANLISESEAV